MRSLLRAVALFAVRLFYRDLGVVGGGRVPERGPAIVVANHPNGLLDPLVLRSVLRRPLGFLAKSTFWGNPVGRFTMAAFDAVPVYRQVDGADTSKNEETFRRSIDHLARGGWLALFPEGVSHSDPRMKPLKTGAARIALRTEAESEFTRGVRIVPVGLLFEEKTLFRSRAAVAVGEPFTITDLSGAWKEDERACVVALTERIDRALADVVLQADSRELWRSFLAVATWTDPGGGRDLQAVEARALKLSERWKEAVVSHPDEAGRVLDAVRDFAHVLQAFGVDDPFSLQPLAPPTLLRHLGFVLGLVVTVPLALVGVLLGGVAWTLVDLLATRLARHDPDVMSTLKLIGGLVFHPTFWAAEAVAVGWFLGIPWALAVLVAGPVCGWVAVRLRDRLRQRRRVLKGLWLRATQAEWTAAIEARRRELVALVDR